MFFCNLMTSLFDAVDQFGGSLGPTAQSVFDLVAGVLLLPLFYFVAIVCDL
jgi:hypothetical protein